MTILTTTSCLSTTQLAVNSPDQYADVLIQQYSQQIRTLYNYGARKFALIGVGQIGCSPNALAQNSPDGSTCVQRINGANQIFNNKLRALVDEFNSNAQMQNLSTLTHTESSRI
ncbi:GDSL esterase/lipase [Sesamum angolense]|uniref:GDSL esterase/lipase n=1 Tax=Sesamum angolense TaxID=2727404 RepID=A0AAE1WTC5_9LAMI|nr:GDSL esterase/lipase [Sesamum angolense]